MTITLCVPILLKIELAQSLYVKQFSVSPCFMPKIAALLPHFIQDYDRNIESAKAILTFLVAHFDVNNAIENAILELCQG